MKQNSHILNKYNYIHVAVFQVFIEIEFKIMI
jgi:hypothetical protein